jgi:hypothetical protein
MSKSLYTALAAAQAEMGRALKDATNPAFKSKYADLASVMDACMPALNKHGIAVLQPLVDDEHGRYVKTVFVHGESGELTECRVPLIVAKNDMQGYGSAVTYARRYGLMSMAGIAPEDDDGNAAAKAAPKPPSSAQMKRDMEALAGELNEAMTEVALNALWRAWKAKMDRDNWPADEDGETSFRSEVVRRFKARKQTLEDMTPITDEPEPEQARYLRAG